MAPDGFLPGYLQFSRGELLSRARRAVAALEECRLCPRDCGTDRLEDDRGTCRTGRHAVVSSAFPHMGEEDCLRGWRGSGTLFFGHCNLRCVFCQNFDISQDIPGFPPAEGRSAERIADQMLALEHAGCHNLNLVTPEHVVPQILEALCMAVVKGFRLPLVYNTSAYDSMESLALLDGVVDVYMPDFKLWSEEACGRYLGARDYAEAARASIAEMHRQVGPLRFHEDGLAKRGVLVRHLVMPGLPGETESILRWLAAELGPDTYLNLMDQWRSAGRVGGGAFTEIDRDLAEGEYREAWRLARDLGLRLDVRGGSAALERRGG